MDFLHLLLAFFLAAAGAAAFAAFKKAGDLSRRLKEAEAKLEAARVAEVEKARAEERAKASENEARKISESLDALKNELKTVSSAREMAEKRLAEVEAERASEKKAFDERMADLRELQEKFRATFAELSKDALKENSEAFLKLAGENLGKMNEANAGELEKRRQAVSELVKPIGEALENIGKKVESFDRNRAESFTQMDERVKAKM